MLLSLGCVCRSGSGLVIVVVEIVAFVVVFPLCYLVSAVPVEVVLVLLLWL